MALDQRQRQKKVERRNKKQKERKLLAARNKLDVADRLQRAASAPILHCCAAAELWEMGIGHVLISRMSPSGNVAFVSFLVDVYCLGVKDVLFDVVPRGHYETKFYDGLLARTEMIKMKPEAARKLVEGAVAYALDLGLAPCSDYHKARAIFGDIDASQSQEEFAYGKDGKPLFIAGPNDSPARCQQVMDRLTERCGEGNHNFLMPVSRDRLSVDDEILPPDFEDAEE